MKIELEGKQFEKIMQMLPKKAREAFEDVLREAAQASPLIAIKSFLDQYDNDSPADQLIARIAASVIVAVGTGIEEDLKKIADDPDAKYSGKEAATTAIEKLRAIANQIQSHLDDDECGQCCKHKH